MRFPKYHVQEVEWFSQNLEYHFFLKKKNLMSLMILSTYGIFFFFFLMFKSKPKFAYGLGWAWVV